MGFSYNWFLAIFWMAKNLGQIWGPETDLEPKVRNCKMLKIWKSSKCIGFWRFLTIRHSIYRQRNELFHFRKKRQKIWHRGYKNHLNPHFDPHPPVPLTFYYMAQPGKEANFQNSRILSTLPRHISPTVGSNLYHRLVNQTSHVRFVCDGRDCVGNWDKSEPILKTRYSPISWGGGGW